MTNEEFAAYSQAKGYHAVGNAAFGVHRGYPFFAAFKAAGSGTITVAFTVAGNVSGKVLKGIRQALPKGCANQPVNQAGTVSVLCAEKGAAPTALFEAAMDLIAEHLREEGLVPSDVCPICGQTGCDGLALVNGYVPVHQACIHGQAQSTAAKVANNDLMGNYFTGFLGALLGGLVGAIPNVLAAVLLERIFALLYALIPLAAYYGYKLCKGKMNKGALVCAIISSVLSLFVVEYITQFIWLCMEFELTFGESIDFLFMAIGDYTLLFFETIAAGELTENLLQNALFTALGLWISWGAISRTGKQEVRSAAAVQASVLSWPLGSVPAAPAAPAAPAGSGEAQNSDLTEE